MNRNISLLLVLILAISWLWLLPSTDGSKLAWKQSNIHESETSEDDPCKVKIMYTKKTDHQWELQVVDSEVRIEFGRWTSLYFDVGSRPLCDKERLLPQKNTKNNPCSCFFKLDCSIPRQYRFVLINTETNERKTSYYPSDSTFTTNNKIEVMG